MRTIGVLVLAVALAFIGGTSPAAAKSQKAAKPAKPAKGTHLTGNVTSIDTSAKTFVLHYKQGWGKKATEQDATVLTTAGTTFKHVGPLPLTRKKASFGDLKVGEKVEVRGLPAHEGHVGATYVLIKHEPKEPQK